LTLYVGFLNLEVFDSELWSPVSTNRLTLASLLKGELKEAGERKGRTEE